MTDSKPFAGKLALVTGASRGIGAATAEALAAEGAHVVLVARTARDLESVEERIHGAGGSATIAPLDLAEPDSIARPDNGIVRVGCVAVWRAVCLPSPTSQSEHLYPATDRWGQPLERAA